MDKVSSAGSGASAVLLPRTVFGYVLRVSLRHQLVVGLLAVAVFLLNAVPLELQRRIVDSAVHDGSAAVIAGLAAAYAGVALAEGALKLALNIYRGWISERAVRDLRRRLQKMIVGLERAEDAASVEGIEVSMILSEVEPVGGFVGTSISEPLLQGGVLLTIFAYMAYLQPAIALVSLAVFSPQLVFVPLMQHAINVRVRARIQVLRDVGGAVIENNHDDNGAQSARIDRVFELNMGVYKLKFSMNFLMNLSHHLGVAAVFAVGGWLAVEHKIDIGTVVAFVSGLARLNDPWGDLVNWFREMMVVDVKYRMIADASARLTHAPAD